MATDGIKILDSDTAHDTYSGIIDLYDDGATIEAIKDCIPFPHLNIDDDFENEIYITAYALAMWEIGYLTEGVLKEVKKVINKGASVKVWTEECDEKTGKQRQKELDKFWNKINSINQKIRKRKKYKTIKTFLFEVNEVLAFQLPDKIYYATIVLDIKQYKGDCTYNFGMIIYKNKNIPTISEIQNCEIIGRKIPSGHGIDMKEIAAIGYDEIVKQGGLQQIIQREAERTGSYTIGISKIGIDHKDLGKIIDKFTRIGKLYLKELYKTTGSYIFVESFEGLTKDFNNLDNHLKVFQESLFKIDDLIEK